MSELRVTDLHVALRGRSVIGGMTAHFEAGRVTAVLGPNGAGKSTLLSCLAGLLQPSSGRVMLDGADLRTLDGRVRAQRIGLLPQNGDVHWDIDVATLVSLGRLPHRGRWGVTPQDTAAIDRAMRATDVTDFAARSAKRLSGGERSRVLLARVLAGEPRWLLADEPLASLDPAHQLDVLERLRDVARRGAGVLLVVHDLTQAARIADDILLIRDGQIVAAGPRDSVLEAAHLRTGFGIDVDVGSASDGQRFVLPLRRAR